jgi:hypothetical protein
MMDLTQLCPESLKCRRCGNAYTPDPLDVRGQGLCEGCEQRVDRQLLVTGHRCVPAPAELA